MHFISQQELKLKCPCVPFAIKWHLLDFYPLVHAFVEMKRKKKWLPFIIQSFSLSLLLIAFFYFLQSLSALVCENDRLFAFFSRCAYFSHLNQLYGGLHNTEWIFFFLDRITSIWFRYYIECTMAYGLSLSHSFFLILSLYFPFVFLRCNGTHPNAVNQKCIDIELWSWISQHLMLASKAESNKFHTHLHYCVSKRNATKCLQMIYWTHF